MHRHIHNNTGGEQGKAAAAAWRRRQPDESSHHTSFCVLPPSVLRRRSKMDVRVRKRLHKWRNEVLDQWQRRTEDLPVFVKGHAVATRGRVLLYYGACASARERRGPGPRNGSGGP